MDPTISTPPCPNTVNLRRNPPRRARPTPVTAIKPPLSPHNNQISHFPIHDIFSITINPNKTDTTPNPNPVKPDNLKVYLRIKPILLKKGVRVFREDKNNVWPKRAVDKPRVKREKDEVVCLSVNDDGKSVTLCAPKGVSKRARSEVFDGFENVFSGESSQVEVFDKMVKPLIDEFLRGKSGTLVALGPSGSGKTHTVFGSPREPGMVPLALNQIFSENGMNHNQSSRTLYLSMFEISERGKTERLCDLLQDGGDLSFHQSDIRGLQKVLISDIQQAECLIARGILKRATAMTNSNSQSSRSQCVINLRIVENKIDEEADLQLKEAVLTIVDLAGAEREKKTGNQGARLIESNFINTTSMVFGQCLRSLLEHQKNPKRPLQKHFQNSLLTKYLREYLEGKKRMALILTVKSGEEDFVDSSLLLRQASPYTKIKFDLAEEVANLVSTKRHKQTMPRIEPSKRMKFSPGERENNDSKRVGYQFHVEERQKTKEIAPQLPVDHAEGTITLELSERVSHAESSAGSSQQERSYMIMQNFAKALWTVLKEYKRNLEVAENKIKNLTESLANENARSSAIEKEFMDLKGSLSNGKEYSLAKEDIYSANRSTGQVRYQRQNYQVAEGKIQTLSKILADEEDRRSELKRELEDSKSSVSFGKSPAKENDISAESSAEQVDYNEESSQGAENKIENLAESLADEKARSSAIEKELMALKRSLSYGKQNSLAKEDIYSANRSTDQVEYQQQNYEVAEGKIQNLSDILDYEEDRSSELKIKLEGSKSSVSFGTFPDKDNDIFAGISVEQAEYNDESSQVAENKIEILIESLADEKAKNSAIEKELIDLKGSLSYGKENSLAKEDIYSANRSTGQVGNQRQNYQVAEGKIHKISDILDNEEDRSSEFKIELEDSKSSVSFEKSPDKKNNISADNSAEQVKYNVESSQVAENKIDNLTESLADEKARSSAIEEELLGLKGSLSNGKENSLAKEDIYSANRSTGQVGYPWKNYQVVEGKIHNLSEIIAGKEDGSSELKIEVENLKSSVSFGKSPAQENAISADKSAEQVEYNKKSRQEQQIKYQDCDKKSRSMIERKSRTCKASKVEKLKRRLAPASSILLKDLGGPIFEDENEKPKGAKGDKKGALIERNITQGSLSLLRLLDSNLHL